MARRSGLGAPRQHVDPPRCDVRRHGRFASTSMGTQVASKAQTGTLATSANPLNIGGDTFYNQYFAGRIDDVRVYNTALSAVQIQSDMNTPVARAARTRLRLQPRAPSPRPRRAPGSTSLGRRRRTTSRSPTTASSGARAARVPHSPRSRAAGSTRTAIRPWPATTYRYRVRAADGAGNLGPYSDIATATTRDGAPPPGLVAAYAFDEGAGTTVADASGDGKRGHDRRRRPGRRGQVRKRAQLQRHQRPGDGPRLPVAAAHHRDDARGLGLPRRGHQRGGRRLQGQRQLLPDGHHAAQSVSPAGGGIFARHPPARHSGTSPPRQHLDAPRRDLRRLRLRLYVNGEQVAPSRRPGRIATSANPLTIGGDASTASTSPAASTRCASTTPPSRQPRSRPTWRHRSAGAAPITTHRP